MMFLQCLYKWWKCPHWSCEVPRDCSTKHWKQFVLSESRLAEPGQPGSHWSKFKFNRDVTHDGGYPAKRLNRNQSFSCCVPMTVFSKNKSHSSNIKYNCDFQAFPLKNLKHMGCNPHQISTCKIYDNLSLRLFRCLLSRSGVIFFSLISWNTNILSPPTSNHNAPFSLVSELLAWLRTSRPLTCQCENSASMTLCAIAPYGSL